MMLKLNVLELGNPNTPEVSPRSAPVAGMTRFRTTLSKRHGRTESSPRRSRR